MLEGEYRELVRKKKRLRKVILEIDSKCSCPATDCFYIWKSAYVEFRAVDKPPLKMHFIHNCFPVHTMTSLAVLMQEEKKFWRTEVDKTRGIPGCNYVKTNFVAGKRNIQGHFATVSINQNGLFPEEILQI